MTQTSRSFAFGPFVLVPERQLLLRDEQPVRIGGRALDLLTALVARPGELVSKSELIAQVWPDVAVDESNLKVNMAVLRRALEDGANTQYIATTVGRGYRFVATVELVGTAPSSTATTAPTPSHNLPSSTRTFGRADAIDAIRRDLEQSPLVSVVGAGGVGKTTVAIAVAEAALGAFGDGVWFVDFAPLKDPRRTPHAIAAALGVQSHSADMTAVLCAYLRTRQTLLVLDNCEHLIESVAACVDQILASVGGVRILATSREPLQIAKERVRRLAGLESPPESTSRLDAQTALAYPAVQLFVERATERYGSFALHDEEAPAVAEICRKLDGIALAIELAAMRIDVFGVHGLQRQLDACFRLLVGRRAGLERHRTLAATLDWSYGLLPPHEAAVLRAVSVFAGVFRLRDAVVVTQLSSDDAAMILAELTAQSLLAGDHDAERDPLYRPLETTRAYSLEKLAASGEEHLIRARHAEHVCAVLQTAAGELAARPAREWGAAYSGYLDDLRGALAWSGADPSRRTLLIRLTAAGPVLWNYFSLTEESQTHLRTAIALLAETEFAGTAVEMNLQSALAGAVLHTRGIVPEARAAMERALVIAAQRHDTEAHLGCLRMIATYQIFIGEAATGIQTLRTFISMATAFDPSAVAEGETHLAVGEYILGRLDDARARIERLYAKSLQDLDDGTPLRFFYHHNNNVMVVRSHALWLTGVPGAAERMAKTLIEHGLETGHELSLSIGLSYSCLVYLWTGNDAACARDSAMLDDLVERHGIETWRPHATFCRGALASRRPESRAEGIETLQRTIARCREIGHMARLPYFISLLAEALARDGRPVEAEAASKEAIEMTIAHEEYWSFPESLRIQAVVFAAQGKLEQQGATLMKAIAFAEKIGAVSWRLRAAIDLARLWQAQARAGDAKRLLEPVFAMFKDGFETRDLAAASQLLAALE